MKINVLILGTKVIILRIFMKMTNIHTSGNGNPSNFHVICGVGLPVALPTLEIFHRKYHRQSKDDKQRRMLVTRET